MAITEKVLTALVGTYVEFTSENTVLALGQIAWETDKLRGKRGNGVTPYNSLRYSNDEAVVGLGASGATQDHDVAATSGAPRLLRFDFAFDTPNLSDGVEVYVPAIGDVLLNAWFLASEDFDGVGRLADIGQAAGLFSGWSDVLFDMAGVLLGGEASTNAGLLYAHKGDSLAGRILGYNQDEYANSDSGYDSAHRFELTDPLMLWVSQDGLAGGAPIGGTTGEAALYLLVVTPESLN